MKKIFTVLLLIICACQATIAKPSSDNDKIKSLEEKCVNLQSLQSRTANDLYRLKEKQKEGERIIQTLKSENNSQSSAIDKFTQNLQTTDRSAICRSQEC